MRTASFSTNMFDDVTYDSVNAQSWSIAEQGIGIGCACLLIIRRLFLFCSIRRTKNNSEATMATFGLEEAGLPATEGKELASTDHTFQITHPVPADVDDNIAAESVQRPPSAHIGIAIAHPKSESKPNIFTSEKCNACLAATDPCAPLGVSRPPAQFALTPQIAAFRRQTRWLGQSCRCVF